MSEYNNFLSEYFGSPSIVTSTGNQELIQAFKQNPNGRNIKANIFNFIPNADCTVKINGSDAISFKAGKEFIIDIGANPVHKSIWSFIIVESGIQFWYMGIFDVAI